jgi:methylmalonyl-CoA/ethylmalonyl-CoA epimerase
VRAILDHIGIAVQDVDKALAFYRDALGLEVEASEDVTAQHVRAHFIPTGQASLELLEATAPESPIAKFVDKRGPGIHHVTLRVDDIHAALEHLKGRGVRLVDDRPRAGAEGALVAFIHPLGRTWCARRVEAGRADETDARGQIALARGPPSDRPARRRLQTRRRRDVRRRAQAVVGEARASR